MPPVRFALLVFVCSSSFAHAGAIISLVDPQDPGPGGYRLGQVVQIDVFAQLDANSPTSIRLRLAQFDVSDSDPALTLTPIGNHPFQETQALPGPIPFWNFGGSTACVNDETSCGGNYYIDGSLSGEIPDILNITYTGLTSSGSMQVVLRQTAPTLLGSLEVIMPNRDGGFLLDMLNADTTDFNYGAEIRFGFSSTLPNGFWTPGNRGITGGQFTFFVGVPEPATLALLLLGTTFLTTRRGGQASNTKAAKSCKIDSRIERVLR